MTAVIQPSTSALNKAQQLGKEAAKDPHFQPCPEDHLDGFTDPDFGEISQEHKDAWCQTSHFQSLYGSKLAELTDAEEERITGQIGGLNHIELGRYEGLYIPLRDAFFDAWEEATDFYPKLEAAIADMKEK